MKGKTCFFLGLMLCLVTTFLAACGSQPATVQEKGEDPQTPSPFMQTEPPPPLKPEPTPTFYTKDNRSAEIRAVTESWATNWNKSTIDTTELGHGGPPRDGIPPLDNPAFISPTEAMAWLADNEPVVFFAENGEARAYPLQILTWHEIVNDLVGGIPVIITFCPLCNSAIVFDRRLNGEIYRFGTSGLLRYSDLVMWDDATESLWQQFTGEAIVGELVGAQLAFLPSAIISFADFRTAYPAGQVLSRETGYDRPYGRNPYVGYDTVGENPFLFTGVVDGRMPALARVVTVHLEEEQQDIAYPLSILQEVGVIQDQVGQTELVVFHLPGTSTALGAREIAQGEDIGATGVFSPYLNGQKLTFQRENGRFVDEQTGSEWNILGQAVVGESAGTQLTPIIHADHFWFSWAAFRPNTLIYTP